MSLEATAWTDIRDALDRNVSSKLTQAERLGRRYFVEAVEAGAEYRIIDATTGNIETTIRQRDRKDDAGIRAETYCSKLNRDHRNRA